MLTVCLQVSYFCWAKYDLFPENYMNVYEYYHEKLIATLKKDSQIGLEMTL